MPMPMSTITITFFLQGAAAGPGCFQSESGLEDPGLPTFPTIPRGKWWGVGFIELFLVFCCALYLILVGSGQ